MSHWLVTGATGEGEDAASLVSAPWRLMRRSVLKRSGIPEFRFRQYLFAAQVRFIGWCLGWVWELMAV